MKTKFFSALAIVALSLTSCSNDEVVNKSEKNQIGFDAPFVNKITRALVTSKDDITSFKVYAWVENAALLKDEGVTYADGKWTYKNTKYWVPGAKYNFAAFYPSTQDVTASYDADSGYQADIKFTNVDGTTDLLFASANAEGKTSGNEVVGFTFNHLLSKVKFTFKNGLVDGVLPKISDLKITNAHSKGELLTTWNNEANHYTWLKLSEDSDLALNFTILGDAIKSGTPIVSDELLLIPSVKDGANDVTPDNVTVEFKVELVAVDIYGNEVTASTDNTRTITATVKQITLKQGYAYNFVATINDELEKIEFEVKEVNGWAEGDEANASDLTEKKE